MLLSTVKQRQKPIGIFDSGVGGLSIGRAIKCLLPEEDLVYFADLAFFPYGNKPDNIIRERSEYIVNFLIDQGCKIIVVACNTATVNAISNLRSKRSIPIIGVEPAIKPAALQSKTGVIGVLATEQTLVSESFQRLKTRYSKIVNIETKACPKFVSLVENVNHKSEQAIKIAEQYVRPLLLKGSDQIILGCTHFSFLRSTIKEVVEGEAEVIDTAIPVVMEVKRRLQGLNLENAKNIDSNTKFWTSGEPVKAVGPISRLWGYDINVSGVRF